MAWGLRSKDRRGSLSVLDSKVGNVINLAITNLSYDINNSNNSTSIDNEKYDNNKIVTAT